MKSSRAIQIRFVFWRAFLSLALVFVTAFAQAQIKNPKTRPAAPVSPSGVAAVVVTDVAQVYTKPDFDAPVIASLQQGQRVTVSKGKTGDMVKFHKIKVGQRIGFIADVDVRVAGAAPLKPAKKASKGQTKEDRRKKVMKEQDAKRNKQPIYFSRFVGALIGYSEFKEGITGVDASDNLLVYGLKITGPDVLVAGPVMDINLALHYGAPKYYKALSSLNPTGFILWADALLVLPFTQGTNSMVYSAFGPLLMVSRFTLINANRKQDLTEANLGLSLALGGAVRLDKVTLRLEGKYMIEKQSYKSVLASIQAGF